MPRTMMPIPPSHWVSERQSRMLRGSDSTSGRTDAPVVVLTGYYDVESKEVRLLDTQRKVHVIAKDHPHLKLATMLREAAPKLIKTPNRGT